MLVLRSVTICATSHSRCALASSTRNGRTLTADDVLYSMRRQIDLKVNAATLPGLDQMTAVDPGTKGDQVRDYLHVEDVAAAFVTLLESNHQGPANVASGVPIRVKDLAGRIASQLGRADLLQLGALPTPQGEAPRLVGDCAVLNRLQWKPAFDIDAGIAQTIAWWRSHAG